jgi:hypothetical protein
VTEWKPDLCTTCGGHTVYAVWNGDYDIVDCHDCSNGYVWISSKDRIAAWPGGPFLGSYPGRFAELDEENLVTT